MQWIVLFLVITALPAQARGLIQSSTQYVNLRAQNDSGLQQDLSATLNVNQQWDIGTQLTYLERFDLYDKRAGLFTVLRPNENWVLETRYLVGNGNDILPEKDFLFSAYHAFAPGISPFFFYRDARYSLTHVNALTLGSEIEKLPNIIAIPIIMIGQATFNSPAATEGIYSLGLRLSYYEESKYSLSVFSFKGKEAAQAFLGDSTFLVDTLSAGVALAWFFSPQFKAELSFDHTDFDELKTEFHTTTLNLSRMF